MLRTSSPGAFERTRLSLCTFLSVAALGCAADVPDSQVGSKNGEQGLTKNGVVVTPLEGDATRATLDVSDDATADVAPSPDDADGADREVDVTKTDGGLVVTVPGVPPFTVGDGPRVIGVTRTDVSDGGGDAPAGPGPRVIDVTRTDLSDDDDDDGEGDEATAGDGKVVVKHDDGKTTITVPGFPAITLTPAGNGEVEVNVPGMPPFRIPKGAVIEAPGGIRIEG
ncbi:MAG: hypothetical protein ABW252_03000 [Polyangiales bacterium]